MSWVRIKSFWDWVESNRKNESYPCLVWWVTSGIGCPCQAWYSIWEDILTSLDLPLASLCVCVFLHISLLTASCHEGYCGAMCSRWTTDASCWQYRVRHSFWYTLAINLSSNFKWPSHSKRTTRVNFLHKHHSSIITNIYCRLVDSQTSRLDAAAVGFNIRSEPEAIADRPEGVERILQWNVFLTTMKPGPRFTNRTHPVVGASL